MEVKGGGKVGGGKLYQLGSLGGKGGRMEEIG